MYAGISTACLYPLETEKSLSVLLRLGYRNFEVFVNCESEFSKEFMSQLYLTCKTYGARIHSVHLFTCGLEPFMFFSNYERRFNDSIDHYRKYFSRAAGVGASYVIFHGDRRDSTLPLENFCTRFAMLSEAAASEGVTLLQENVARCRSAKVSQILGMKKILGDKIKFVLDVKQAIRAGETPFDMCDAMGKSIELVHLSDSTPEKDCLLPGAGTFDLKRFCQKLAGYSFNGPLIIEVYRDSYKEYNEIAKSADYISQFV